MSLFKLFDAVDGIISIKTHFKGDFGFIGFLYLAFLFMEEIWHDVQKWYGYFLSLMSSQKLAVSPSKNDMLDLWPNIWSNNSKSIFFLDGNFFVFGISFVSPKNTCFLYALCHNVTVFFSFSPKLTLQTHFWNKQLCPKLINVIIENNLSHKSGAKSTLCNVAINVSQLFLHIFIFNCPFFTVTWCPSITSICLSVFSK